MEILASKSDVHVRQNKARGSESTKDGEVAERLNAPVLKAFLCGCLCLGGVAERFKAVVLKTQAGGAGNGKNTAAYAQGVAGA